MKKKKILLQLRKQKISLITQKTVAGGRGDSDAPYCVSKKTECEDGCFDTFKEDGCAVAPVDTAEW